MSRCYICDHSQSADSTYHSGLYYTRSATNNRVVYHAGLGEDICLACLEHYTADKNYWTDIDGTNPDFNAYIPEEEPASEYPGCTDESSD